jgi:RNA polymerase sigma-70 factor, ECF subfamily
MEQEVRETFERCLQRYPTVQLSFEDFRIRIDAILSHEMSLPDEKSRMEAFARIHHEDLFLAIACSRQDRIAWEYFADDYRSLLKQFSVQACGNSSDGEDLAQEIITKMLKEKNRLAGYNGRGSLAGWLRAAVSHAAVDRFRRMRRQVSLDDPTNNASLEDLADPEIPDEEENLDARWGPIVSNIVNNKIAELSARDRLLLGLYYLRGISLKIIGKQFGIHEATASRWLDGLRRDIRKQVESELRKKHGLRTGEIQSLWKQVSIPSVAGPIAEAISPATDGTENGDATVSMQKKAARRNE